MGSDSDEDDGIQIDDEIVEDSSEEEDGEDLDRYEEDGFVVDTVEEDEEEPEEGGEGEENKRKKKKRKKKKIDQDLDEDDVELIEENLGLNRFKRLKKRVEDEEDVVALGSGDEGEQRSRRRADDEDDFIVDAPRGRVRYREPLSSVSTSMIEEAEEIFDDSQYADFREYEEEEEAKPDALAIYKTQFEPSVLDEQYITEADRTIRDTDYPERVQLYFAGLGKDIATFKIDEAELMKEATWIFSKLFSAKKTKTKAAIPKIASVLGMYLRDKLDIPYICQYKKDYYLPELDKLSVWRVIQWDAKWRHLEQRKEHLREAFKRQRDENNQDTLINDEDDLSLLDSRDSEEEVNDVFDHFRLNYSLENTTTSETSSEAPRKRRPVKQDLYKTLRNTEGIAELSKRFGITAKQFGENLMVNIANNQPVDDPVPPSELAETYVSPPRFADAEAVLRACRYVLAQEIACDPHVRQSVRTLFLECAAISTEPTQHGKREIDDFHEYKNIKRLRKKPRGKFEGSTQFLQILKAQKEGLITVEVGFTQDSTQSEILKEMENLYCSTGHSSVSQEWNEQRRQILREAFNNHLVPLFEKELKQKLEQDAKDQVIESCAEKLRKMIEVAPYYVNSSHDIGAVLACTSGGEESSTFVMLDSEGEPLNQLRLRFMNFNATAPGLDGERKRKDLSELSGFIRKYRPDAIAVGATDMSAHKLYEDIKNLIEHERIKVNLYFVDASIAKVARDSTGYREEFKDIPAHTRQTISLGRFLQNPVNELSLLCTATDEILCLKLHPLQDLVDKTDLMKALHREFSIVVNDYGVDINKAMMHKSAAGTLQFVSGLGPRKALDLLQSLHQDGKRVLRRYYLRKRVRNKNRREDEDEEEKGDEDDQEEVGHLSQFIYLNAAPFLRVLKKYFKDIDTGGLEWDILSDTRIHPQDESIAARMAADVTESSLRNKSNKSKREELIKHIRTLFNNPRKESLLNDLDLDSTAAEWQRTRGELKKYTLYDIRQELITPYKDARSRYKELGWDELFTLLTGETEYSLQEGQLVTAKVSSTEGHVVNLRLESGVTAKFDRRELADYVNKDKEQQIRLSPGTPVSLQVVRVHKPSLSLELAIPDPNIRPRFQKRDEYLIEDAPEDFEVEAVKKEKKPRRIKRPITHPCFQNINFQEVVALFADKDTGEFVIRPSSKGLDHLTISWKFKDVIVNVDIVEKDKPFKNSPFLGKKLVIGKETYESLDEVTERYIKPVLDFSGELVQHRSFMDGSESDIAQKLKTEKEGDPRRIPYYIGLSNENPGRFVLYYLPNQRVKKEVVSVTPDGYRLRQQYFKKPDKLIQWFKLHYRELPQRPTRPQKDEYDDEHVSTSLPPQQNNAWPPAPQAADMSWPPAPSDMAWPPAPMNYPAPAAAGLYPRPGMPIMAHPVAAPLLAAQQFGRPMLPMGMAVPMGAVPHHRGGGGGGGSWRGGSSSRGRGGGGGGGDRRQGGGGRGGHDRNRDRDRNSNNSNSSNDNFVSNSSSRSNQELW
eukprot:TRINITY_DN1413_c0_g2_i1.p1 TRINITY_DN1413_c0_g2~~TRINITY_DN1413_c0_g2_i1.p1  ORF type:complete len:1514 (+),score=393.97 TRINITY_DN1413_c0_g2_i1:378-4919(+)